MSKALPPRPHLNWLKNRAKERLAELRAQEAGAKLAEAQLEIAREYGCKSWRALVARVKEMQAPPEAPLSEAAIAPAPVAAGKPTAEEEALLRKFRGAINGGRGEEVRVLLETEAFVRASVNAPIFAFEARPLAHAKRNAEMVDLLLAYGADLNLKSAWWAGGWGLLDDVDEATAKFLIARGAVVDIFAAAHLNRMERVRELLDGEPGLVNAKGGDGCRPLHFAKTGEMIDLLLARGADIGARCVDHEGTAAQWMVPRAPKQRRGVEMERSLATVRHLVNRGAGVDVFMAAALDDEQRLAAILGTEPAVIEAKVGAPGIVACPKAPGEHIYVYTLGGGKTAAEVAAEFGSTRCLKLLKARSTPRQRFLLACALGDRRGAEAVVRAEPGVMQELTVEDQGRLAKAAFNGDAAAVQLMLDLGFDPFAPGSDTGTVLHCAAWQGQAQIVEMVLGHPRVQARRVELVNAKEPTHQSTPLGWCCHGSGVCRNPTGDYVAVARTLLALGAKPAHNLADATAEVRAVVEGWGQG